MDKMKIGIIDADLMDNGTRHPNLALMKISGYFKEKGYSITLIHKDYEEIKLYGKVYISKVFSFTKIPEWVVEAANVEIGGTGFFPDGGESLPYEIEHHMPDYELYIEYINTQLAQGKSRQRFSDYLDYSIGFATRGCFRKCEFCVNKKYDTAIIHSPIDEFLDDNRPALYLWDDNFLAYGKWEEVLNALEATQKPFQFRQGLDIRLMTDKKAERISKSKYHGDFIFAFDHIEDKEKIERKLKLWRRYCTKTTKLYVLCGYDSQDETDIANTFERIKILMKYGSLPYIMRYESYKNSPYRGMYVQLARWCNQPQFFKKKSFRQFCVANQDYHSNPETNCSAYQSMLDFEKAFPNIANRYFDLRFDELNEYGIGYGYGRRYANKLDCDICESQSSTWISAYFGTINPDEILAQYYAKKLDLQCLTYKDSNCSTFSRENISYWLCNLLLSREISELLGCIKTINDLEEITASNIPQFSNFDDAAFNVIKILIESGEEGMRFEDLGYYLGKTKENKENEVALKKYGENHAKLACLLDLSVISTLGYNYIILPSLLGYSYHKLSLEEKKRLSARLILRIPIIQKVLLEAIARQVSINDFLIALSEKTKVRRKSNIISIIEILKKYSDEKMMEIFNNIVME